MAELDQGMSGTKWQLLDNDYLLAEFLGRIRSRFGWFYAIGMPTLKDLPAMDLGRMFVEPMLAPKWVDPETEPKTWPTGTKLLDTLARHPRILVQGDPGSGKTILSSWLAWHVASVMAHDLPEFLRERVPLPVALRDMRAEAFEESVDIAALAQILARQLLADGWSDKKAARLAEWVAKGRYILILDGIDEIASWQRARVATWLQQAERDDTYALATSRLVGYDDYPVHCPFTPCEIPGGGSYNQLQADAAWAQVSYLMPFDQPRVWQFIQKWYHLRSADHYEAVKHTSALAEAIQGAETTRILARTPNLLGLMAVVFRERAYLPDGKALLYREIVNAYLNTIDQQRKIPVHDALVGYGWEIREQWLAAVAFEMQLIRFEKSQKQMMAFIRGETTAAAAALDASAVLATEAQVLGWLAAAMARNNVTQPELVAREFLAWTARRSGLLLPRGEGLYGFSHLSFLEYFCARFLLARFLSPAYVKGKLEANAPVTPAKLTIWSHHDIWRESFIFLFELLSAEREQEWLVDLLETLSSDLGVGKALPFGEVELVARLTLNRHVNLSKEQSIKLLYGCLPFLIFVKDELLYLRIIPALMAHGLLAYFSSQRAETTVEQWLADQIDPATCHALLVEDNSLTALPPLARLPNLFIINLITPKLMDIGALADHNKLMYLTIGGALINDITALANCPNLRVLDITRTQVTDITALSNLKSLRVLCCGNTPITDFTPVQHLENLTIVGRTDK